MIFGPFIGSATIQGRCPTGRGLGATAGAVSPGRQTKRLPPLKCYISTSICYAGKGRALQESRDVPKGGAEVQVYVPYPLREFTRGVATVDLRANDLAEAINEMNRRYPGLAYRILDDQGGLRRFVNVFVNDESVSHRAPREVPLHPGDEVTILPSVAGG